MARRSPATAGRWAAVDTYIADRLLPADPALAAVLDANAEAALPPADVSPTQGKMLHLLARMAGARRILEVGTLGGYSTIWLARALPDGGTLVTLEVDPHHAALAQANLATAGCAERVQIIVGPAAESLGDLSEPFDFIFIDADKQSNTNYLRAALRLSRPGTTIVLDNVVRDGAVIDADSDDPSVLGTRAAFDWIAAEPRLSATAIQTVGCTGWDGFVLAVVD